MMISGIVSPLNVCWMEDSMVISPFNWQVYVVGIDVRKSMSIIMQCTRLVGTVPSPMHPLPLSITLALLLSFDSRSQKTTS